ncbi:hypothetical protein [Lentilactobacillus hilgardii]|uniref:hypothetical protein n=1 Tax=Lentilactobacillus hilgardii TaxID=1588 RepID=UPI0021A78679|nr:hypothetical protein [Lentilactobacillus hilgardii]MCT3398113.1 hypothetical protein [Lentilactobacillus hilgardii]
MAYDLAKVTDNGNQLIAQILANKSSLSIDKIDVSDTQLSASTNIQTMTSISNVVQTIQANGYSKNSNSLIISTVLSNEGITADYKAWVFGIWGSDSTNGTSQLIAVITSTNSPDTVPAYSGTTPVELTYKFAIGFSNASNLSINMSSDSFATNDTVVHTTGDETIDGQKKFDTDPTDGAGNAYAKTVDVNQQLDKKVNATDTVNWQKYPITDVTGSLTAYIGTTYQYKSIKQLLDTSVNGFYITYVDKGVPDTPDSLDNLRGIIQLQSNHVWGILTGELTKVSYYVGGTYNGNTSDLNWIKLANDSAVVHSTDMRKPASDVAGIEEVNTKQDKIGYTPADDSKVAHKSGDDAITYGTSQNYSFNLRKQLTDNDDMWNLSDKGLYEANAVNPQHNPWGGTIWGDMFHLNQSNMFIDNMGVISTYTGNTKKWIYMADDSQVAHLSGTNNFDTVPTVNNNPLLLASSLPSDLARTGQDTNFTDKLQQAGSDVITQGKFVQSDSETDAQSASSNDSSGFYYTEEAD